MKHRPTKPASWHSDIKRHFEQMQAPDRSIASLLTIIDMEHGDKSANLIDAVHQHYKYLHIYDRSTFISKVFEEVEKSELWDSGFSETYRMDGAHRIQLARELDEILDRLSELINSEEGLFRGLFLEARDRILHRHEWSRADYELACGLPSWTFGEATATLLGVRHDRVTPALIDELPDTSPLHQRFDHLHEQLLRSPEDLSADRPGFLSPTKLIAWVKR